METKLISEINATLRAFPEYWEKSTLIKSKVIEDLRSYRVELLEALLSNENVKAAYSLKVEKGFIFKSDEFISMLRFKNYWDNSYTKFSNEIGLTSDGRYLKYNTDVVVDFPHKDCVLEGGMSNEDVDRNEIYYHNILAKEEIDIMLTPKVLSNVKKYSEHGEQEINEVNDNDNLIIKGNNLIALHSLKNRYAGEIKQVFIDPPYYFIDKKNDDTFGYNSNFKLSTWLTFMKTRLEIARELLAEDGSLWISIDDDGAHYLKVLCDGVFGSHNFINNVIWEKKFSPQNDATWLSDSHDHILVFAKNKEIWRPNLLPRSEKMDSRYSNPDNDYRGAWTSSDLTVKSYSEDYDYPIQTPSGRIVNPAKGRCWNTSKVNLEELIKDNRIWFGEKGGNVPRLKTFLNEVKDGVTAMTIWKHSEVGHNQEATQELNALEDVDSFATPKPEQLLKRILHLGSNENDIVLDFFMGSATTQAAAMKMKRQFIGIEQMDYINTVSVPRLKKVIEGEQGGISKDVEWQGGGSFVYAELHELNMHFVNMIQQAKNEGDLGEAIDELNKSAFLNFKVDIEKVAMDNSDFSGLSLEEKKRILIETLDMNQLYLSYSEMDDSQFDVPESVKKFNHSFYKNEGGSDSE